MNERLLVAIRTTERSSFRLSGGMALLVVLSVGVVLPQCAKPLTVSAFSMGGPINVSPVIRIGGSTEQPLPVSARREIDEEISNSYAVSSSTNTATGVTTTSGSEFNAQAGMLDMQIYRAMGTCRFCGLTIQRIPAGSWVFFLLTGAAAKNWGGVEGEAMYYRVPAAPPQGGKP
jgi:hypothetical protein